MSDEDKPTLAEFFKLLYPPLVESLWYNGKSVKLDGYHFRRCRFDKCELLVTGSNFKLEQCYLSDDTRIRWGGSTINIIQLFTVGFPQWADTYPWAAPQRHDDGTISVGVQ